MTKPATADHMQPIDLRRTFRDAVTGEVVSTPDTPGGYVERAQVWEVDVHRKYSQREPVTITIPRSWTAAEYKIRPDKLEAVREQAAQAWNEREDATTKERKRKETRKSRAKPEGSKLRKGGGRKAQTFPGIPETFRNAADAAQKMIRGNDEFFDAIGDPYDALNEWFTVQRGTTLENLRDKSAGPFGRKVGWLETAIRAFFAPVRSRRWADVEWWAWDQLMGDLADYAIDETRERLGTVTAAYWYPPAFWAFNMGDLSSSELATALAAAEQSGNDPDAIRYGMEGITITELDRDADRARKALDAGTVPKKLRKLTERRIKAIEAIVQAWPRQRLPDQVCWSQASRWDYCSTQPIAEWAAALEKGCAELEACLDPAGRYEPEPEIPIDETRAQQPTPEQEAEAARLFDNPGKLAPPKRGELAGQAAVLGRVVELETEHEGQRYLYRWKSPRPILWWNKDARALAWIDGAEPPKMRRGKPPKGDAAKVRQAFEGQAAGATATQPLPAGRFETIGRPVRIVYESKKRAGGGDGKIARYKHPFPATSKAWRQANPDGPAIVAIRGNRMTVNDRGIVY